MQGKQKLRIGIANLMMLNVFGDEAEKIAVEYFFDLDMVFDLFIILC